MKSIFILFCVLLLSCNCSKNKLETNNASKTNVVAKNNTVDTLAYLPFCIQEKIRAFQADSVSNPPKKIYQYTFEGKTVFYINAECCDNFSELYNDSCRLIAHPDGGFTGKGDRKAPAFHEDKKDEKLVWEDKRK